MPGTCPYCGEPYGTRVVESIGGIRIPVTQECRCPGAEAARAMAAERELYGQRVDAWKLTGAPERFKMVEPNFEALDDFEANGWYYLYGPIGRGKTRAACAILKAYVSRYQRNGWTDARFVCAPDWLGSMRADFAGEEGAFKAASKARMLVFDEFGKGKPTQWAMERLFRLINDRYNAELPTVFTSKRSMDELSGWFAGYDAEDAEDALSRIDEMCKAVRFDGPDYRKLGRKEASCLST